MGREVKSYWSSSLGSGRPLKVKHRSSLHSGGELELKERIDTFMSFPVYPLRLETREALAYFQQNGRSKSALLNL
jgi:hypothetical protein